MVNNTDILVSTIAISLSSNSTNKHCFEKLSSWRCYLIEFGHTFAYFLLAFALLPQIIHLFTYRHRYVAGISYIWIIIRLLALTSLMIAHTFQWSSILELIAFISTIIIFIQIVVFSNSLHRQNKVILVLIILAIWIFGRILGFLFIKQKHYFLTIGYVLLGIQMLPQILLNSLLRTAKALSKFSIILLAMSDVLLFSSFPENKISIIYSISIYYSFSFLLYIFLQHLVYNDDHIHLISRSAHTILTPGVDIFTGLDTNGIRSNGQDPQMFSIDDLDSVDGVDVIYQSVTTNKPSKSLEESTFMKTFLLYAILGCIFCIETVATIILVYRVGSPWIIFVPISILLMFGILYFLRMKTNTFQNEILRKIL